MECALNYCNDNIARYRVRFTTLCYRDQLYPQGAPADGRTDLPAGEAAAPAVGALLPQLRTAGSPRHQACFAVSMCISPIKNYPTLKYIYLLQTPPGPTDTSGGVRPVGGLAAHPEGDDADSAGQLPIPDERCKFLLQMGNSNIFAPPPST